MVKSDGVIGEGEGCGRGDVDGDCASPHCWRLLAVPPPALAESLFWCQMTSRPLLEESLSSKRTRFSPFFRWEGVFTVVFSPWSFGFVVVSPRLNHKANGLVFSGFLLLFIVLMIVFLVIIGGRLSSRSYMIFLVSLDDWWFCDAGPNPRAAAPAGPAVAFAVLQWGRTQLNGNERDSCTCWFMSVLDEYIWRRWMFDEAMWQVSVGRQQSESGKNPNRSGLHNLSEKNCLNLEKVGYYAQIRYIKLQHSVGILKRRRNAFSSERRRYCSKGKSPRVKRRRNVSSSQQRRYCSK